MEHNYSWLESFILYMMKSLTIFIADIIEFCYSVIFEGK